ncbi:DUF4265 domain-containing protein [Burkholderia contaminans]|uniref:DUF4265 domain-containing protein n=1 Tax=Burkholderia contaminans TaxID=488447 RepID=UPI001581F7DA|nr:DUF4265 domain-containing protein [Burkholderia contaminans]
MDEMNMDLIEIFVGLASNGEVVREELPARKLDENIYELLASPGLALHVANGDIIKIASPSVPVEIVRRGRNVCVQIFAESNLSSDERRQIDEDFRSALLGSVDGETAKNMCFSVPARIGFPAIERFFNELSDRCKHINWYFGNVYADDGITPLNWWALDDKGGA